jgi:hypothetical protein
MDTVGLKYTSFGVTRRIEENTGSTKIFKF